MSEGGIWNCEDKKVCPRAFITERGRVVFQGYLVDGDRRPTPADLPAGETQVEMPWAIAVRLARWVLSHGDATPEVLSGWTQSLFRLEAKQQYLIPGEEEKFNAWREGRQVPRSTPDNNDWYREIRDSVRAGRTWQRVHVVDQPLTDYLRYELEMYTGSAELGYQTLIADRSQHPELAELTEDFYLLDGDTDGAFAVLMRYDDDGHFLDMWRTNDEPVLSEARRQRDLALRCAVSLRQFLSEQEQAATIRR
jgi:hypothetical protein